MPYSTTVTFLDTQGGSTATADVTARLWMLWNEVGGPQAVQHQQEAGSARFDLNKGLSPASTISFAKDGTFSNVSRSVGLSIQDTNRVSNGTGWLFRSGRHEHLPTDPIEVLGALVSIPASGLPALLPRLPLVVERDNDKKPVTSIAGLTASFGVGTAGPPSMPSGIDITATGTTTKTGVVASFRFTGRIVLSPSDDIAISQVEALSLRIDNPRIVFLPGPSVISAIQAELLNLVRFFIMRDVLPMIRTTLEQQINSRILSTVGRRLPDGRLPRGVLLSVRSVAMKGDASALDVRACLGAFGGVLSKLPASSGSSCPSNTLLWLGYGLTGLSLLREVRDTRLASSRIGGRLIELYYECAPEVSMLLTRDPHLASRVAQITEEVTDVLSRNAMPPASLAERCERLLKEIASRGSAQLQAAAVAALEADVWRIARRPGAVPAREG